MSSKITLGKSVLSENGLVKHVQSKICTKVMGKEKLLVPKFDYLHKHVGKKQVTTPMFDVPKGIFYYAKNCQHVKNEVFNVSKSGESVFDMVL